MKRGLYLVDYRRVSEALIRTGGFLSMLGRVNVGKVFPLALLSAIRSYHLRLQARYSGLC